MTVDHIRASDPTLSALPLTSTGDERAAQTPWPELAIGTILAGRFELRSLLGQGATGLVFEALDRSSGQALALKLLQRHDASALYRLKHEFRALAEIAHPNLAAMHELFVDEQQRGFFTMQLVRGCSFLEYVRPQPGGCAEDRLRACLLQLTLGVRHLHEHGKLHCDLKPSNVLVSETGSLCIVDFGLAQSLSDPAGLSGVFEGTPAYASPEQVDPAQRSYASDWYAVGVMLYEALTGARPWPGNGRELLHEKARQDPAPPSQRTTAQVDPALQRLCLQLLERDRSRRADAESLLSVLGGEAARVPDVESSWPFVGRELERLQLEAAFERSRSGQASALVVRGASGMGKTSLAQEFLTDLQRAGRARVFQARCFAQEALHFNALDGVIDALTSHLRRLPEAELELLLPADVSALSQIFPVLRRVPAIAREPTPAGLDQRDLRVLAFAALRELLLRLAAKTPVVLSIDDLHWADRDSARLLQELLQPPLRNVWLLATFRSDCGSELANEHGLRAQLTWLELGPLPEPALLELTARVISAQTSAEQRASIARRSGGHPLLARELIRHAAEHPDDPRSDALGEALRARLAQLSAAAQSVLELVCVAGQRVPRAWLFETHAGAALGAIRELRFGCALRESTMDGDVQLEPYHDSVRQVVNDQLDAERTRSLHGLLGDLMHARGDTYLERVVQHYMLAGRTQAAADLAERAAQHAANQLAFHSAAGLLELALEHAADAATRERLRLAAAEACARAGRSLAAARHYEAAASGSQPGPGAPVAAGELRLRALICYCISGHGRQGRALLSQLAAELQVPIAFTPIPLWRGLLNFLLLLLTGAPFLRKRVRGADADQALPLLWRAAPALLVLEPEQACYFVARALLLAARQGQAAVYGQALGFHLALLTVLLGRRSWLIDRHFSRAHKLTRTTGDFWEQAFVQVMQGSAAQQCSDPQRAVELTMHIALRRELASPFAAVVRTSARCVVLPALHDVGRVARLTELAEGWIQDAADSGDRHMEVAMRVMSAHRHLRHDDAACARAEVERAVGIELDYVHPCISDAWWAASILLYQGLPDQALAVCDRQRQQFGLFAVHSDPARVAWWAIEGGCAAALAARGQARERSMQLLARCARGAKLALSASSAIIAAQLAANSSLLRGDHSAARGQLRRALEHSDARGLRLRAASLRLALARLEPGRALEHERLALRVFAEEGIANPQRWAYMLAPGLSIDPDMNTA